MLIDSHIHIGKFFDEYYSPSYISQLMADVGVDYYAVSSTTICEENYIKVLSELHELILLDGPKVLPVMWITPEGLKGNIAWFLEANITWRMLKIHPFLHQKEWRPDGELFAEVLDIARELQLPLLIHTGNEACCKADIYEQAVKENPDIVFILAHGRPIDSSIRIARRYENAYIDSAFMPIEHMKLFIENSLSEKLLWGTDMCIPLHFEHSIDLTAYYQQKLISFRSISTQEQYENVICNNIIRLLWH